VTEDQQHQLTEIARGLYVSADCKLRVVRRGDFFDVLDHTERATPRSIGHPSLASAAAALAELQNPGRHPAGWLSVLPEDCLALALSNGRAIASPTAAQNPGGCHWLAVYEDDRAIFTTTCEQWQCDPTGVLGRLADAATDGRSETSDLPATPHDPATDSPQGYPAECGVVLTHNGRALRWPAAPARCDYVRVTDPDGREAAYWDENEWAEEPESVIAALLEVCRESVIATAAEQEHLLMPAALGDVIELDIQDRRRDRGHQRNPHSEAQLHQALKAIRADEPIRPEHAALLADLIEQNLAERAGDQQRNSEAERDLRDALKLLRSGKTTSRSRRQRPTTRPK
jgi:hypothetical protein